jgi:hypothetical protein
MHRFALERIKEISGQQSFDKLIIDGNCPFDKYEETIQSSPRDRKKLGSIYQYMQQVADLRSLPPKKFKDITPDGERVKEYEFKKDNLRVYAFKKEGGKIVVIGGYKNTQKRDLRKFRSIKAQYLQSLGHGI